MKKSLRLFISGSVQAMFFKQQLKEHADLHNVKGYVRNTEDGRLEVFLEGDHPNVETMVELCKQGPKHSIIRNVELKDERLQDFKEFKIMRL